MKQRSAWMVLWFNRRCFPKQLLNRAMFLRWRGAFNRLSGGLTDTLRQMPVVQRVCLFDVQ